MGGLETVENFKALDREFAANTVAPSR